MSISFYDQNADSFFENTVNVDMSSLYDRFTEHLSLGAKILDAGCGSGRDSKAFLELGYNVHALDASAEMVSRASSLTGLDVELRRFEEITEQQVYDGIWTCASLLHVPRNELSDILNRFSIALKSGGVWYLSFKYGNTERFKDDRHFTDLDELELEVLVMGLSDIAIDSVWTTVDKRPGRDEKWLNVILNKS